MAATKHRCIKAQHALSTYPTKLIPTSFTLLFRITLQNHTTHHKVMSDRYYLRSGASQPSTSGPQLPPVQQNTDRGTEPPIGKVLGTLNSYEFLNDRSRVPLSDRQWDLTDITDWGVRKTPTGWAVKRVTVVGDDNVPYHGQEEPFPPNTVFWSGGVAEGHHSYMVPHEEWTFYGVDRGQGPVRSAATQQPIMTTTEAGSGAGGSSAGVRK